MCLFFAFAKAQEEDPQDTIIDTSNAESIITQEPYDPLRPAKAAFYGAAFPGLGQIYNKDYWKVPLVYGALGSTVYAAIFNSQESERFRTAFKLRRAGRLDEFSEQDDETGIITNIFSDDALIDAQDQLRRRRDLFILLSAAAYVLQIIEANVDAHLSQYDVDDNLTFAPDMYFDDFGTQVNFGAKLTYRF